jgi:hypothetical protein
MSLPRHDVPQEAFAVVSRFRDDFFDCLSTRGDTLFELTDALLCADGPVRAPVDLTMTAEHRRGYDAMYDALNSAPPDGGPVDLVDHLRSHPAPARPPGRRRPLPPRGRSPPSRAGSPPPVSATGSGKSARTCPARPVHPNPTGQAPDGAPAPRYDVGKTVKRPDSITARDRPHHKEQAQALLAVLGPVAG